MGYSPPKTVTADPLARIETDPKNSAAFALTASPPSGSAGLIRVLRRVAVSRFLRYIPRLWGKRLTGLAVLSFAAWMGNAPLVARAFGQVNWAGLWVNIAVIPLMSVVLACGMVLTWLAPWAGMVPLGDFWTWLLLAPAKVLVWLAQWTNWMPGRSMWVSPPGTIGIAIYYAGWVLLFTARALALRAGRLAGKPAAKWTSRAAWTAGLGLAGAGALLQAADMRPLPPPAEVRFTSVPGRGLWDRNELLVIEHPSGAVALVGAVTSREMDAMGLLQALRIRRLDAVVDFRPMTLRGSGMQDFPPPESLMASLPGMAKARYHPVPAARPPIWYADESALPGQAGGRYGAVPGAEWLEVALGRDARTRRLSWVAARVPDIKSAPGQRWSGLEMAFGRDVWPEQVAYRMRRWLPFRPGSRAEAVFLTMAGRQPPSAGIFAPGQTVFLRHAYDRGDRPPRYMDRVGRTDRMGRTERMVRTERTGQTEPANWDDGLYMAPRIDAAGRYFWRHPWGAIQMTRVPGGEIEFKAYHEGRWVVLTAP